MKKPSYALTLLILLIGSFLGGIHHERKQTGESREAQGDRRVLHYVDPMNPSHISDKPGQAPCGMALEPVYADGEAGNARSRETTASPMSLPAGSIRLSPRRQQVIGIRSETVERASQTRSIRTLGRVTPDENKVYRILAGGEGLIWDVQGGTTGSLVEKDQLLSTLYNYLFLARQQQYLYALDLTDKKAHTERQGVEAQEQEEPTGFYLPLASYDTVQTGAGGTRPITEPYTLNNSLDLARLELYNLGVTDHQMSEIARTRQIARDMEVRSPVTGIVLARNVSPQQRLDKGTELFRIADIARVWIVTDIFPQEVRFIRQEMRATLSLPGQDTAFEAKVTNIPSQFDPTTRTLKVRLEAENPLFELRPDMFVDVQFHIDLPEAITVPADAVLDSGAQKTVFVDLGNGYFEPRRVTTGWHSGSRIEIKSGLSHGERIVVSGNFLIDSESRMNMALASFQSALPEEPELEAEMGPRQPEKMDPGFHGSDPRHGFGLDPVCGMRFREAKARAAGLSGEYAGQTYFFCSRECLQRFAKTPDRFAQQASREEARQDTGHTGGKMPHD